MPRDRAKPRVFIGSSSEGLEVAGRLQAAISHCADAEVWNQGFFPLTSGTLEALDLGASDFDFAVLVLTPDDIEVFRGDAALTARSNVLLEIGLFVGRLGRERTLLVVAEHAGIRLPSDLWGIAVATFVEPKHGNLQAALNPAALRIIDAIRAVSLGPRHRSWRRDGMPRLFARSDGTEFVSAIEHLLPDASRVVLIGTGLNILQKDPLQDSLMRNAAAGNCHVEIFLADPESPAVQTRLIEEECGDDRPPVGRVGLQHRIAALLEKFERLGQPPTISIRLVAHYPTFALLIVDKEYFIYPYAYATLGNYSPVIRFSSRDADDHDMVAFLDRHYEMVKTASVDARQVCDVRNHRSSPTVRLFPFALYCIPPADTQLYAFGSAVLGYDVRRNQVGQGHQALVGNAAEYGFHLTCCDVLYFLNREEIESVVEEVAFLAKQFAPFPLDHLQVKARFPDPSSISIAAHDPTGALEALHCELVHRVYRRAAASSYTLQTNRPPRSKETGRADLMTKRYKAPYILKEFEPHFTLLANVPADKQDEMREGLQRQFERQVSERWTYIDRLVVMEKPEPASPWRIGKEIFLV